MAFSPTTHWEVRKTGSDSNGGAFNAFATGTDYSNRDSPQVVYTDLVIGGSNNLLTSAANPFGPAHVGNVINITGGSGFTIQRVQINSVAGSVATVDKNLGTINSTGGAGNLGGALASIELASSLAISQTISGSPVIHVKSGTYTLTASISINARGVGYFGYGTARYDDGTPPLITTATDSTPLWSISNGSSLGYIWRNINFSNTAAVRSSAILCNQGVITLYKNVFDGFTIALDGNPFLDGLHCTHVEVKNCTSIGIETRSTASTNRLAVHLDYCNIHNNTGGGISIGSASGVYMHHCLVTDNGSHAITVGSPDDANALHIDHCTIANNTGDGIRFDPASQRRCMKVASNLLYGNTGAGFRLTQTANQFQYYPIFYANNAFGSNGGGNVTGVDAGTGANPVLLTANPFVDGSTRDYRLNSAAGGGALCRGAGFPGAFINGPASYSDIGAIQAGVASAAGGANSGYSI